MPAHRQNSLPRVRPRRGMSLPFAMSVKFQRFIFQNFSFSYEIHSMARRRSASAAGFSNHETKLPPINQESGAMIFSTSIIQPASFSFALASQGQTNKTPLGHMPLILNIIASGLRLRRHHRAYVPIISLTA